MTSLRDSEAYTLEALRGQGELVRGLIRQMGPTTYRHLPGQIEMVIHVIKAGAAMTPELDAAMMALSNQAADMVATINRLDRLAEVGNPEFDAAGAKLAAAVDAFANQVEKAELA